ncbi:hypothetical protein FOFC_17568 [Fusarium oxysporum]|nr:hypothetical protein FOFC_17568 [Fusarium oxysporum]
MALHPAYRWDWFDETWAHKPKPAAAEATTSHRQKDLGFSTPLGRIVVYRTQKPADAAIIVNGEYQTWQTDREASDGDVRDPIGYWTTKQSRYPRLFRMNLDFLTIQPMSAEYAEIIAICQVLRSWYRASITKDLYPLLKSHLENELALAESKWLLEGEDSASEVDDSSQQQQVEELVSTSESETE